MKKSILTILFSVVFLTQQYAVGNEEIMSDSVFVNGIGKVEREPDQATLTVSLTVVKPSLKEAKKKADDNYKQAQEILASAGIKDKDIRVTRLNTQSEYDWTSNKRIYKGERVWRSLTIRVKDLHVLSELMQALIENGHLNIDGLQGGFQNPAEIEREAMKLATEDAKNKAEFLANQFDRTLGKVKSISSASSSPGPIRTPSMNKNVAFAAQADQTAPPEENLGVIEVSVSLDVKFRLEN